MKFNGYVFKTKASHLDGGHQLWSGMERDGLHYVTLPKTHHTKMTTITQSIPARLSPGTRTAPSIAGHQDGVEKYVTDGPKLLCARHNITIGTWNMGKSWRTNTWNDEIPTEHPKALWSMLEDIHEHGVGFLIHKNTVNAIMGCWPVSSRLITIRLKASPFNITIIQAYAPTTDYDDDDIEDLIS